MKTVLTHCGVVLDAGFLDLDVSWLRLDNKNSLINVIYIINKLIIVFFKLPWFLKYPKIN